MPNPALTQSEAVGQGASDYRGGISHAEEAAIPKLPGREVIDPSRSGPKMGISYSLYGFLFSSPQRIYKLNLMDPGERAIMYLLLRIRDQILDDRLASLSMNRSPAGAIVKIEGLSEDFKNEVFVQNMDYSRWDIEVPEVEDVDFKKFNPVIEFAFKVVLPLFNKDDSRPSSVSGPKKLGATQSLGFRKSAAGLALVSSLSTDKLGLDEEKDTFADGRTKKSQRGDSIANAFPKGHGVGTGGSVKGVIDPDNPQMKSQIGNFVSRKSSWNHGGKYMSRKETLLLSEDPSMTMLRRYKDTYAINLDFRSRVRIVCLWNRLAKSQNDRAIMLQALSLDFALPYQVISAFIRVKNSLPKHQILAALFPAMQGGRVAQRMCFVLDADCPEDHLKMRLYSIGHTGPG